MIMTDWGGGQSVPMYEMHAGNDLVCPGKGAAQIIKGFKSDPDWNGKGYVNMTTISYQDQTDPDLPVITKDVPNFGGYELNKEGTEVQSTTVNGDADADHSLLCDEAWKAIEDGYATYKVKDVRNWWTGTTTKQTTVSYKVNSNKDGQTNKQVISLGDLQKAAINICNFIMDSTEFAKAHGFTAQSLNEKYADILKDITSHSKDAVQSTVADKGLQKLINTVKDLDSSEYTADSWKALEDAVAAAKDVVAKADASQSEIDAAVNGIIEALGNLEYGVQTLHLETAIEAAEAILAELNKVADKADVKSLVNLIESAKKLLDGNYTSDSLKDLKAAIKKAEDVIANPNRTEAEIGTAYADLINAILNLQMKANKAALKAILDKANEVLGNADAYVAATIDGLDAAAADAQNVLNNADAVQDEVDAAVRALTRKVADARLLGDVDNDGAVTTADSAALLAASAEITSLDADAAAAADVNGDDVADTNDAVLILQYAAEKVASF